MNKQVMVVASHADDEALGCGGTVARHVADGDTVQLVLMTDGVTSRDPNNKDALNRRLYAAKQAHGILGIAQTHYLDFPDNAMDSLPLLQIVKSFESVINKISPSIVYTHFHGDLNVDHRITQQAVMTACRPAPGYSVKKIYGFEIPSSTEWATPGFAPFCPTFFVDISSFLQTKLSALQAYAMEMREKPHARSVHHVEALARHRGNSVGVEAAEAYVVYRYIQ